MRYVLERVTEPELEPVTLAWMKRELGEFSDVTERDDDIDEKIESAREWVEKFTGHIMVDQTWRLSLYSGVILTGDSVSGYTSRIGYECGRWEFSRIGEIMLRRTPVLAVTGLATLDVDGAETVVSTDQYALRDSDSKYPRLAATSAATWTGSQDLRVTFRAGYVERTGSPVFDASVIPARFKQAVILYVKWLYDGDADCKKAAEDLIRSDRVELGFA